MAVAIEVVDNAEVELREHSETIRREHELAYSHGLKVIEHAIACGDALLRARALIPRGSWTEWVKTTGLTATQATTYARVARYKDIIQFQQPTTMRSALQLLKGADQTPPVPQSIQSEIQRMRADNMSYEAISQETGVPRHRVVILCNPGRVAQQKREKRVEERSARQARIREERRLLSTRLGGGYSQGYSQIRVLAQLVERLTASAEDGEVRRALTATQSSLYNAEDNFGRAMKLAT